MISAILKYFEWNKLLKLKLNIFGVKLIIEILHCEETSINFIIIFLQPTAVN